MLLCDFRSGLLHISIPREKKIIDFHAASQASQANSELLAAKQSFANSKLPIAKRLSSWGHLGIRTRGPSCSVIRCSGILVVLLNIVFGSINCNGSLDVIVVIYSLSFLLSRRRAERYSIA